jgi:hypothetical protein
MIFCDWVRVCVEELKITQSSQRTLSALRRGGEELTQKARN